jgi:hypothetical protein
VHSRPCTPPLTVSDRSPHPKLALIRQAARPDRKGTRRPPTILVDSIEKARHFRHDNRRDQFAIELCNGRHIELSFHLFTVSELRSYFAGLFDIEDLRGLDVFHNRFAPDPRWNPDLALDHQFCDELDRLEEAYATRSGFVERAAHLLLVARRRGVAVKSEPEPAGSPPSRGDNT